MNAAGITQLLAGKATRRVHGMYLLALGILAVIFLGACGAVYSTPFTFRDACVSNLGNPALNPAGWWAFSVLFIIAGPVLVPHYLHVYRQIYPATKGLANGMLFFLVISSAGMTGVGIVNELTWTPHAFFAVLVFGGIGLAMGLSLPIFIRKIQLGHSWPTRGKLVAFLAVIFAFIGLMVAEFIMHDQDAVPNLNLAEWYAFFGIFTWIFGVHFLITG